MGALTESEAAAVDGPHVVHGVDAEGAYLGLVSRASASDVANGPAPGAGWRWLSGAWQQPEPDTEQLAEAARQTRNARLTATDWVVVRASEVGQPIPAGWLAYRAALRDVPEQPGFPTAIIWPDPPTD